MPRSLGVAVIGAGMVGRAHAAGYRAASQVYDLDLPDVRLVAIADAAVSLVTRWYSARIGEGVILDLRTAVFNHVQKMPIRSLKAGFCCRNSKTLTFGLGRFSLESMRLSAKPQNISL